MSRRPSQARAAIRGFTLLEVLISIALVLVLIGSMFAFFWDMLSTRRRALDYAARQLAAATLIQRVESDLMSCLVGDRVNGAGVQGDTTRIRIMSRGVAVHLAERGADDPEVLGDLQQAEYRFNEELGLIEARRLPIGRAASVDTSLVTVGGSVYKVRFRYHDSDMWRDSFDSLAQDRLPVAVEIAVWFDPWPGAESPPLPGDPVEPQAPQRLTYDATAGFDEAQVARRTDVDLFDEPRPDRVRVILVPDASSQDPYAADPGQESALEP